MRRREFEPRPRALRRRPRCGQRARSSGVNLRAALKILNSGQGVGGEFRHSAAAECPGGLSDPAFISPQNRDTLTGQVVGEHEEWLVAQRRFVTVRRT